MSTRRVTKYATCGICYRPIAVAGIFPGDLGLATIRPHHRPGTHQRCPGWYVHRSETRLTRAPWMQP